MRYFLHEIQSMVSNAIAGGAPSHTHLTEIGFDSRRIAFPKETLFFAFQTDHNNGHHFIVKAYESGVRHFVIEDEAYVLHYPDISWLKVNSTLATLQQLASAHRKKFSIPVIGITGSNGKTVVKEWLNYLLSDDFIICRSPRSYNSQIGVAISILGIESYHTLAIIEAGISKKGEMQNLEQMILPSMAVCTHLGSAHDEGFYSSEEKAFEKFKLFKSADVGIYPGDNNHCEKAAHFVVQNGNLIQWIKWGHSDINKFKLTNINYYQKYTEIKWLFKANNYTLKIPFSDKASVENAMTCLCALSALERLDPEKFEKFQHLPQIENRLEFKESKRNGYIVNDTYSNDSDALEIALDFTIRQQPNLPVSVILSSFEQSAPDKQHSYNKIAQLLAVKNVELFIGVGEEITFYQEEFKKYLPQSVFFETTKSLQESLDKLPLSGKSVLIKGSRKLGLERIVAKLEKQEHQTILNINLDALAHNFKIFKQKIGPKTHLMAMVKAFGYGSGTFEVAKLLSYLGVDYLAVAYTDEGVKLREAGINTPIMVMNADEYHADSLVKYQLEPVIFSTQQALNLYQSLNGKSLIVHIEFDTGMHRLGFSPLQAEELAEFLLEHPLIIPGSVFSHLASSEDNNSDRFTKNQIAEFQKASQLLSKVLGKLPKRHILNTGGILRFPDAKFEMVRLGIGLYGIDPRGEYSAHKENLLPVASFKTRISQIKEVAPGESVSYGRGGISHQKRTIAIIPVGYADGYKRTLGHGKGKVFINGFYCYTVGTICMDMCMIDVTNIPCEENDEVELFGENISVNELAEACNTIAYEILTSVSQRVKRVFTGEY